MKYSTTTVEILLATCLIVFFKRGNNQTMSTLQTPTALQPCEERPFSRFFDKSSFYFEGACYFSVIQRSTWHRAKTYCESVDGSLVSIHSMEEVGFLLRFINNSDSNINKTWIGLNSLGSDGTFQWTDWTAVDFTYFAANERNNFQHHKKCVSMNKKDGLWNGVHCSALLPFICKRINDTSVSTILPVTQDPTKGNCKKGWIAHLDRCYYVGGKRKKDHLNWTEAMDFCHNNGGYLTSIRNLKDQDFLTYLLQIIGDDTWIGLHRSFPFMTHVWLDNSELRFTHWGDFIFRKNNDCVKMMYNHVMSGAWEDEECHHKLGFICQTRRDPSLPPLPSDHEMNCAHPKGWHKLNRMCFQLFQRNPLTRDEAELFCNKEGGHLVSVSDSHIKAVVDYLTREMNHSFFIGLKYDIESRTFKWLNNFPMVISRWEKSEPIFMTEDTCFASTSEGYWQKVQCDEKLPYICQITKGKPKLKKFVGNCSSPSKLWIPGNYSYCYILDQELQVGYLEAWRKCHGYDSHLISLHSIEESKDLIKLIKPGVRSIFLGFERNWKGGYTWDDNSPINFVNWDEGEPSNYVDNCVEMMTDSLKWRVTPCKNKKHFICMDLKSTLVVEDVEIKSYSEQQRLSIAATCSIVFGVLIGVALIVAAALYSKRSCGIPHFRRQDRYNRISSEKALCEMASSTTVFNEENKR